MTLVETIIKDESNNIHRYVPLSARITQYGIKRPDVAVLKYPIQARVKQNNTLSYIQDIVPLNFLSACWNFHLTTKDERGFDLDGEDTPISRFDPVRNGRFKGQYALTFDAIDQGVTVPVTPKVRKRIDFSGQFDIQVWFTPQTNQFISGTDEPILFSKYDGSTGIEIGITNQSSSDFNCFARIGNGSTTSTMRGNLTRIPLISDLDSATLIRCWRDDTDTIHLSVNGAEEDTLTVTESLENTEIPITFGHGRKASSDFKGWIHNVRVYSGNYLNEEHASRLYIAKPSPFIMKFAGRINNVNDKQTPKTIQCRSFGNLLHNQQLDEDSYTSLLDNSIRTGNVYNESSNILPILEEMLSLIDSDMELKTKESVTLLFPSEIVGSGSFIDILKTLLADSDKLFYITPRKTLVIEDADGIDTDFVFQQGGTGIFHHDITESEERNIDTASSVVVNGFNNIRGFSNRTIDENKLITVYAPYIKNVNTIQHIASKIKSDLNAQTVRYEIKAPALINHIRPLQNVTVKNFRKNINIGKNIAEITYEYPKGTTIINVGVNPVDLYNLDTNISTEVKGITNNLHNVDNSVAEPPTPVNTPPMLTVTLPTNNSSFDSGESVSFMGTATDTEDGTISNRIQWTSNNDGLIGTGSAVSSNSLSSGSHTITASVTDNGELQVAITRMITINIPVPSGVGALTSLLNNLQVSLSWAAISGTVTGYRIYRGFGNAGSFIQIGTTTGTSYTDSSLTIDNAGQTVQYQVTAYNNSGESVPSSTTSVELPDAACPPDSLDIFNHGAIPAGNLVLRIEPRSCADSYDIYFSTNNVDFERQSSSRTVDNDDRDTLSAGGLSSFISSSRINIYHINLDSDTRYYYRVYGRNALGIGTNSENESQSTD